MTAPLIHIQHCLPQCNPLSHDQDEILVSFHNANRWRSNARIAIQTQATQSSQPNCDTFQQKNNNRKRQLSDKATSSPSRRRLQNRVRFEVDSNNEILRHVQNPHEQIIITEEEERAMWWSHEEGLDFKRRAKKASKAHQEVDYITKFKVAWKACCSESSSSLDNIPLLSNTPTRGLEMYMFPQEIFKHRQRVIRSVLNAQAQIPAKMKAEHRAQLLGAASKRLSRPMRRLSRVLAIGDARVSSEVAQ